MQRFLELRRVQPTGKRAGLVSTLGGSYNHWVETRRQVASYRKDSFARYRKLTGITSQTGLPPQSQASRARVREVERAESRRVP